MRTTGSTLGFTPLENIQLSSGKPYIPIEAKLRKEDAERLSNGVDWSSGTRCLPPVGVSREPRALPVGLHEHHIGFLLEKRFFCQ